MSMFLSEWNERMDYVYAAVLGVVQGVAEFLPISSSGHLVIAEALLIAKKWQSGTMELDRIPVWAACVIGIFQAIAILPGVSRAGSTVASGLVCGLKRPDAARFSFFIAIPAIGGATLLELLEILAGEMAVDITWQPMLLGAVISFVVGVFCLRWLIRLLVADRLHWFAIFCLIAGSLTIAWQSGLSGR